MTGRSLVECLRNTTQHICTESSTVLGYLMGWTLRCYSCCYLKKKEIIVEYSPQWSREQLNLTPNYGLNYIFSSSERSFQKSEIAHIRYIKILTWLCGFRVKIAIFSRLQKRFEQKGNQTKYRKMTRKPWSHVRILIYLMCGFQSRFFISLNQIYSKCHQLFRAKLFFIIFLIIKIYCFQKTLRAENFVIAVGGRPRFPLEVSEVIK